MNRYTKSDARQLIATRLQSISDAQHVRCSESIREMLQQLLLDASLDSSATHSVLSYHAISTWREVDLSPLEAKLPKWRFTYVPPHPESVPPEGDFAIVLVPLYGFNDHGYRLGHGGGWYDKFLQTQPRALKIGVGLEISQIDIEPGLHDISMDIIVTDTQIRSYTTRL